MNTFALIRLLRRSVIFAAILVGGVGCTNGMFVESKDITKGAVWNFDIGMSKQQVLEIAQRNHVHAIRPILNAAPDYSYLNLGALVAPGNGRAMELDDGHGLKVVYTIAHCKVSRRSVLGDSSPPSSISVGDSSEDFVVNMRKMLSGDHALSVHEIVSSDNGSWFVIDKPDNNEYGALGSYDIWSFEVGSIKPAGAEFVVYFSEGSVVRIAYKRPRMRVE
ncbi:hypothetical protein [Dyella choica]|uniref:Uncharacterized protein n=1 Tax=Dyella choica TaxID=1927959 RepID=A0A3S0PGF9_9GAMM|nr:hypothetical protein [Dyella choica]RUL72165.1 hypothetical protein EKH80_17725 [Dyella choica]